MSEARFNTMYGDHVYNDMKLVEVVVYAKKNLALFEHYEALSSKAPKLEARNVTEATKEQAAALAFQALITVLQRQSRFVKNIIGQSVCSEEEYEIIMIFCSGVFRLATSDYALKLDSTISTVNRNVLAGYINQINLKLMKEPKFIPKHYGVQDTLFVRAKNFVYEFFRFLAFSSAVLLTLAFYIFVTYCCVVGVYTFAQTAMKEFDLDMSLDKHSEAIVVCTATFFALPLVLTYKKK